jgi:hypothetical protein
MNRSTIAASLVLAFIFSGATAALAATQEYDITVPVTVKGMPSPAVGAPPMGALTMTCAVGGTSLAYSTATGTAAGANGQGTKEVPLMNPNGTPVTFPVNVTVVLTADDGPGTAVGGAAAASPNTQYLCWGKFARGTTPLNFVQGAITH